MYIYILEFFLFFFLILYVTVLVHFIFEVVINFLQLCSETNCFSVFCFTYNQHINVKVQLVAGIDELNGLKLGEGCVVKFANLQYGNYKVTF